MGSFVTRRLVEAGFEVHLYDVVERETAAKFHLCDAFSADHSSADIIVNMLPGSLGNQMTKSLKVKWLRGMSTKRRISTKLS